MSIAAGFLDEEEEEFPGDEIGEEDDNTNDVEMDDELTEADDDEFGDEFPESDEDDDDCEIGGARKPGRLREAVFTGLFEAMNSNVNEYKVLIGRSKNINAVVETKLKDWNPAFPLKV